MSGGLQLPGFLKPAAEHVGMPWPDADEQALYDLGMEFVNLAKGFAGRQTTVSTDTTAMLVVNHSAGLTAFRAFNARLANAPGSHMHVSVTSAAAIGVAYLSAAAIVLSLKIRTIMMLGAAAAALAFEVLLVANKIEAAYVADWIKHVLANVAKAIDDATRVAIEALDQVLRVAVQIIETYDKVATVVLQARPADLRRSLPGSTQPSPVPGADRAQLNAHNDPNDPKEHARRWGNGQQTAEDMAGVQPFGQHVPYGTTELGKYVAARRRESPSGRSGRNNYASVKLANGDIWYDKSGPKGSNNHAEMKLMRRLEQERQAVQSDGTLTPQEREARLSGLEIDSLYTERQPCADNCQKIAPPGKTTWTYPWEPLNKRTDSKAIQKDIRRRL